MKKLKNKKINSYGLSIIEVLVGIFIFVFISLAVWSFQDNVFLLNSFIASDLIIQQETRQTFKIMSSAIRSLSPSSAGAYPISQVSTSSFTFFSDINNDGLKEQIRYFLDGTTLKKGVTEPSGSPSVYNPIDEVLSNSIKNIANGNSPIFEFYDSSYNGQGGALTYPIDLLEIRLVKTTITVDQNPNQPPAPITITTQVSMRNLKDNL